MWLLSDYEMPQKDGLQFLKEWRETKNEIPFILFTGKGREEVAMSALNLGVTDITTSKVQLKLSMANYARSKVGCGSLKAESALIEAQTSMRAIIDSTSDMIWSVSFDDFVLLDFNQSLKDYFQKNCGITIKAGMSQEELFPDSGLAEKWRRYYKRLLKDGPFTTEYKATTGTFTLQLSFNVIKREGKLFSISVFGKDVTEEKKTEEILKRSEEHLRAYLESSPVSVFVANPDGKYEYVNDAACKLLGYSREELLNMTVHQAVPKDDPYSPRRFNELKEKGIFAEKMSEKKRQYHNRGQFKLN